MTSKPASFAVTHSSVGAAAAASPNPGTWSRPEKRGSFRFSIFGRVARLDALGDRGLTRVQNLSNGGAKIETAIALKCGEPVKLSFNCAYELQARVVWTDGQFAGIRFLVPIDAAPTIRNIASRAVADDARAPRVPVHAPARAMTSGNTFPTRLGNISQQGMMISHSGGLNPGAAVTITLGCGLTSKGTVRWSNGMFAGVELVHMLPLDRLTSAKLF